jgi:septal ring factor EnvC (AmiA/AmiB activator)
VHKAEGPRFELHPRRVATALRRGLIVALCLAVALLCRPAPAQEDHPDDKLKAVEKALEESRKNQARYSKEAGILAADLARLRDASVAAAQTVQLHEAAIADIEEQLGQLAIDEGAKLEGLQSRARQYDEFLMALQRLARNPPEALALAPGEPVDAVRSALLLSAAIPQIEVKARELQAELDALAALRRQTARNRQLLLAETTGLTKQQQSLKALIARKAALQDSAARRAESTAQRLQQLSAEAGDLHQLIESLEAERRRRAEEQQRRAADLLARAAMRPPRSAARSPAAPGPEVALPPAESRAAESPVLDSAPAMAAAIDPTRPKNLRPFAAAHGAMLLPVAGKLKRRYGESDEFGAASKGILIRASSGGQVVAPFDGRIEFAGPFRGYGQILIIEHGDGYHSLLAGLERIDGVVGQWLVAGEPVGIMPTGDREAALYLELRRHGQPINPSPWLATRDDKVSG